MDNSIPKCRCLVISFKILSQDIDEVSWECCNVLYNQIVLEWEIIHIIGDFDIQFTIDVSSWSGLDAEDTFFFLLTIKDNKNEANAIFFSFL